MTVAANFKYITSAGNLAEGHLSLEDYKTALDSGMSTKALLNSKYSDTDKKFGSAWEQALENLGIYVHGDPNRGIQSTKLQDMLDGTVKPQMAGESLVGGGTIMSPSQQGTTPATRVFFPEVVMDMLNEVLQTDYTREQQIWSRMIASQETIPEDMYTQPLINTEAPGNVDPGPIAQNTLPNILVSISTSQRSYAVQTQSIGLQISDQALRRASLDLVGIVLAKHTKESQIRMMWDDINKIHAGSLDSGDAAFTPTACKTLDSTIGLAEMSQKAWLQMLYDPTRAKSIDSGIMDLASFLSVQGRTGRPVVYDPNTGANVGNLGTYGLNTEPNVLNIELDMPNVMIVPTTVIGANQILLFDSTSALRRVVSSSATYQAIERMVLQRTTFLRFDFGEITHRLFDSAFDFWVMSA